MSPRAHEQYLILERIKYYEAAYNSAVKLLKAVETGSEAQTHLFSAAKYYQEKISNLRRGLQEL